MELWDAKIVGFMRPYMQPMVRNIQNRAMISFPVMLWLYNDKEVESICEEVEKLCKERNKSIFVCIAMFSTNSNQEVAGEFCNPSTINRLDIAEVRLRMELYNHRIGDVFTRFSNKLHVRFEIIKVISFGINQFPTQGIVVDALNGHLEVVKYPIDKGANIESKSNDKFKNLF